MLDLVEEYVDKYMVICVVDLGVEGGCDVGREFENVVFEMDLGDNGDRVYRF